MIETNQIASVMQSQRSQLMALSLLSAPKVRNLTLAVAGQPATTVFSLLKNGVSKISSETQPAASALAVNSLDVITGNRTTSAMRPMGSVSAEVISDRVGAQIVLALNAADKKGIPLNWLNLGRSLYTVTQDANFEVARNVSEELVYDDPLFEDYMAVIARPDSCNFCKTMSATVESISEERFHGFHSDCRCVLAPIPHGSTARDVFNPSWMGDAEKNYEEARDRLMEQREEVIQELGYGRNSKNLTEKGVSITQRNIMREMRAAERGLPLSSRL